MVFPDHSSRSDRSSKGTLKLFNGLRSWRWRLTSLDRQCQACKLCSSVGNWPYGSVFIGAVSFVAHFIRGGLVRGSVMARICDVTSSACTIIQTEGNPGTSPAHHSVVSLICGPSPGFVIAGGNIFQEPSVSMTFKNASGWSRAGKGMAQTESEELR